VRINCLALTIGFLLAVPGWTQSLVDSFPSPGREPRGLAWDGQHLWCADAEADSVYQLDSSTGAIVSGFPFSIDYAFGGISWGDSGDIWIANGDFIYRVIPSTGEIAYSFPCPGG
jgi:hypothetical protein